MTINVTFESIEEMKGFAAMMAGQPAKGTTRRGTVSKKELTEDPITSSIHEGTTPEAEADEDVKEEIKEEIKEEVTYTLVDVRGKLSELQKAGKKEKVQALIRSFDTDKLSKIDPALYPELMKKAGGL